MLGLSPFEVFQDLPKTQENVVTIRLTRDDLMHIAARPKGASAGAIWDGYVNALTSQQAAGLFEKFEINTPLRVQHFLATMAGETNFSVLWESGAYSAVRIVQIFGVGHHSARVTAAEAQRLAYNGPALFDRVYGIGNPKKARELGNTEPGDGWRFRGLGPLQITGRAAHTKYAQAVGCNLDDLPQYLNCLHAAMCEWQEKNCNKYADNDDAVSIRKLINGGSLKVPLSALNGMPNVMAALRLAKNVITPADFNSDVSVAQADQAPVVAPVNDNKPVSLLSSTEMQAAGLIGTGGAVQMQQSLANAAAATASSGQISIGAFLLHLAADPAVWVILSTVALAIYLALKRRKRFHIFGV